MQKILKILFVVSALPLIGCGGGSGGGSPADIRLSAAEQVKSDSLKNCLMANRTAADQADIRSVMSASSNGTSGETASNNLALRAVGVAINQCGVPTNEGSQPYFKRAMFDYMNALASQSIG